jgi:outer membrane protein assembly factor BamB
MYAIYTSNGTLKWKFGTDDWLGDGATIGEDGIIYFGNKAGNFFALYPDGTKKWQINDLGYIKGLPAIAEDGSIIIGTGQGYVISISPDGHKNWGFNAQPEISASPAIDKYGIIYIGTYNGMFYALNPNGTLRWKYKTLDTIFPSAAIAEDGTIYVGAHSDTFIAYLYAIEPINNNPPEKTEITGKINGKPRTEYTYTTVTSDPDGDNLSYYFDWGDGKNSGWTEFVPSDSPLSRSHSWNWRGKYTIKVKAKDVYNMEGDWETLVVTIPRIKTTNIDTIFIKLLEQFSMLQKLLKQLDFRY